jgi:protein SCO1/2
VYYTKSGDDDDYLVDHSIIMYLVNPDGEFVTFYGKNFDAPSLAKSLEGHLTSWDVRKQRSQQQASALLA